MPKCYTSEERYHIISRLKEEAALCLAKYGIKRTTVDELVQRVGIPKGTFYLFYPSKEMLLFTVIGELHESFEQELLKQFSSLSPAQMNAEGITEILLQFYLQANDSPLLKLMDSDEIELLARKLPPEVLNSHERHDQAMAEKLFASLPLKKGVDYAVLSSSFRSLFLLGPCRHEIGSDYPQVLRSLLYGLLIQLF